MQVTKISASPRTDHGKGASRRLRAAGKLPAVTYGKDKATQALVVDPVAVTDVLTSELGINSLIELDVEGKSLSAMIGDYQYHPLTRRLIHADFVQIEEGQKVDVKIPLRLHGKAKGIVMGGKLRTVFRELPVRCEPGKIPVEISHDITELDVEQPLAAGELSLPEGVEVLLGSKRTVAVIAQDRRTKSLETEDKPAEGEAAAEASA